MQNTYTADGQISLLIMLPMIQQNRT